MIKKRGASEFVIVMLGSGLDTVDLSRCVARLSELLKSLDIRPYSEIIRIFAVAVYVDSATIRSGIEGVKKVRLNLGKQSIWCAVGVPMAAWENRQPFEVDRKSV